MYRESRRSVWKGNCKYLWAVPGSQALWWKCYELEHGSSPLRGAEDEMQVPVALRLSLAGRARVREQGSPIALGGALMTLLDDPG